MVLLSLRVSSRTGVTAQPLTDLPGATVIAHGCSPTTPSSTLRISRCCNLARPCVPTTMRSPPFPRSVSAVVWAAGPRRVGEPSAAVGCAAHTPITEQSACQNGDRKDWCPENPAIVIRFRLRVCVCNVAQRCRHFCRGSTPQWRIPVLVNKGGGATAHRRIGLSGSRAWRAYSAYRVPSVAWRPRVRASSVSFRTHIETAAPVIRCAAGAGPESLSGRVPAPLWDSYPLSGNAMDGPRLPVAAGQTVPGSQRRGCYRSACALAGTSPFPQMRRMPT